MRDAVCISKGRMSGIADDRLFVTHNDEGYVWKVMTDGSTREILQGGMTSPRGIAVLPSDEGETVHVGNVWMLYGYDNATGEPASDARQASAITLSPLGEDLLLTSWFAGVVTQQDTETGETLAAHQDYAVPLNAIAFQGDWIVAELGTGSVVRADGDDPSERTTLAADLAVPLGLAATVDALWVDDMASRCKSQDPWLRG